jgi:hypothetical protein
MSKYFDEKGLFLDPTVTQHGGHMVMTNVVPPTKTKFLTIDTRFRDDYQSDCVANYNITLPERINDVKSMRLTNIEIPVTYYNISTNLGNNTFSISILNRRAVFVIPDGQYNEAELVAKMNAEITMMTSPFTSIIFSIENKRCLFANMGDKNDCRLNFIVTKNAIGIQNKMSTLGWLLGFRKSEYLIDPATSLIGESFVSLTGPRYLYLIVDEFKNGNPHSFVSLSRTSELSSQQILARISMDPGEYPFGTVSIADDYGSCCSDSRQYSNEVNIQRLNVRLVNELGTIMDLNGMDFSFCLELKHL